MTFEQLKKEVENINNEKNKSKWSRGVGEYTLELLENVNDILAYHQKDFIKINELKEAMLNGATDWGCYSWGGCSLIYNGDICERLATPSEQKRTKNGEKRPNRGEEWLDTQARAIQQASNRIVQAFYHLQKRGF